MVIRPRWEEVEEEGVWRLDEDQGLYPRIHTANTHTHTHTPLCTENSLSDIKVLQHEILDVSQVLQIFTE